MKKNINNMLTGKWFIKKRLFGFKIMVEKIFECRSYYPDTTPEKKYVEATADDLIELNIHIL